MMKPDLAGDKTSRSEPVFAVLLFCGLLAFHGWAATVGWKNLNLPGVEFRQAQTAISAFFIQRDHDFSLTYPTPVLGKPWSVPMEFPLYQWTVVWLSDSTGLELTKAGRTVNLACFYLALPALFLLLGRIGLAWPGRLVALSFVLSCPLYIFYGRAFLIETMALMFAVWFLFGYLKAIELRRPGWIVFASLAGSAAGLVKVTTFLFILLPAAAWTVAGLWKQRPGAAGGSWRAMLVSAGWALGTVALPCVASCWWVRFADATKAQNPMADFLGSGNMTGFNFGSNATRFSAEIWRLHLAIVFRQIATGWTLAGAGVLALCFTRRRWAWIGLLLGCFFAVQLIFPLLYAWHEYYYVANAFMLLVAIGLVACGVLESRLSRVLGWGLILVLHAVQVRTFLREDFPLQRAESNGGSPMTQALRVTTEPDDVLIIAGSDWGSIIPYGSQRRALMIRSGVERDSAHLTEAFARLHGESVGALILLGEQQRYQELLERSVRELDIDPRPVFTYQDTTVYYHRRLRLVAIPIVKTVPDGQYLQLTAESGPDAHTLLGREVKLAELPLSHQRQFAGMSPIPYQYFSTFGVHRLLFEGRDLLSAHPDTRLWFNASPGRHGIMIEIELMPAAYDESVPFGDRSDGVDVIISTEGPDRVRRPVFSRWLNPRDQPGDRGLQTIEQPFDLGAGEAVVVEVDSGPQHYSSRDWALLGRIEIK